jgi:hypothetical protein
MRRAFRSSHPNCHSPTERPKSRAKSRADALAAARSMPRPTVANRHSRFEGPRHAAFGRAVRHSTRGGGDTGILDEANVAVEGPRTIGSRVRMPKRPLVSAADIPCQFLPPHISELRRARYELYSLLNGAASLRKGFSGGLLRYGKAGKPWLLHSTRGSSIATAGKVSAARRLLFLFLNRIHFDICGHDDNRGSLTGSTMPIAPAATMSHAHRAGRNRPLRLNPPSSRRRCVAFPSASAVEFRSDWGPARFRFWPRESPS